ncbi:Protein tpx2, partial [Coemansia sp. RSA 2610]
ASTLPLTEIEEILLWTELRSEERHAYDEDRAERERIREEVLARKRQEEERREEEEIKRLRKLLVHKAQPVRHYKPTVINPSDRPLTVPKTPKWNVRTRKLGLSIAPTH